MSIFQRHLSAALAARAVSSISAEADPLEGVVTPEGGEDAGETPAGEGDAFAEQRAALNANNGMIRNRLGQAEDEEGEGEGAAEETPAEDGEGENTGSELDVTAEGELDVPIDDNLGDDIAVVVEDESQPEVDGEPIADIKDSGDVEFDNEGDEFPEADELDTGEATEAEIEAMGMELDMLGDSAVAIESFGMNPTAMAILQTTGLLSGTALSDIGLESVQYVDGKHDESVVALEAIGEKIKDTAAKWAGKILGFAKSIGSGVVTVLEKIWAKISGAVTALGAATWDKAKAGAAIVKAHPYKTILATVATIGAVAGVITLFGGMPALTAGAAAVRTWMGGIVTKINGAVAKFPFASIKASLNSAGTKIVTTVKAGGAAVKSGAGSAAAAVKGGAVKGYGAVKGASVTALGWSQTAVKSAGGQLKSAYTSAINGSKALGARVTKLGSGAAASVGKAAGQAKVGLASAWTYVSSLAVTALKLIKEVILKGLRAISSTFSSLLAFVKGGAKTAEAAAAAA